jgi:CheY-like chemotaxis protein
VGLTLERVLLVDDEEDYRRLIAEILRRNFVVEIVEAASGNQAIEVLQKMTVAVVICDLNMPDGDGIDLLMYIEEKSDIQPAFIMFTGTSAPVHLKSKIPIILKPNHEKLMSTIGDLGLLDVRAKEKRQ